ncbi:MAG: class I SAM-dependent methyltransferase [Gaiellaceae bacterium]
MKLLDVVRRADDPAPWSEGDNIPWSEPGFSARMLAEHLSQAHDLASRRSVLVDRHVEWIETTLLGRGRSRILDLGCGPGLYCSRLARKGHECVGIDFSPASVAYASEQAVREELSCRYVEADIREADFGRDHDLVMLLFGELNVFRPGEAEAILRKARAALTPSGGLLLELHPLEVVHAIEEWGRDWGAAEMGLYAAQPHLWLQESFWDAEAAAATVRRFVVDAATGAVQSLCQSFQGYSSEELRQLLGSCGFELVATHASLGEDEPSGDMVVLVGRAAPAAA